MKFRIIAIFALVFFSLSLRGVRASVVSGSADLVFAEFLQCADNSQYDSGSKDNERRKILTEWFEKMNFDDSEARDIVNELKASLYLVKPAPFHGEGGIVFETMEKVSGFKVMPVAVILKGDEEAGPTWKKTITEFPGPTFDLYPPLLVLKDGKFSDFWKKITFLYQGRKVMSYVWQEFELPKDSLKYVVTTDFYSYSLVFKVLAQEGGNNYQKLLSEKAELIKQRFLKNKTYLPPDYSEAEKLSNIFDEKPFSPEEIRLRWKFFWVHSTFLAMEQLGSNNEHGEYLKILYLEALHRN